MGASDLDDDIGTFNPYFLRELPQLQVSWTWSPSVVSSSRCAHRLQGTPLRAAHPARRGHRVRWFSSMRMRSPQSHGPVRLAVLFVPLLPLRRRRGCCWSAARHLLDHLQTQL